ncbi:MAG: hypothetical protein AAF694_15925 [Bacteroidota bacterium]
MAQQSDEEGRDKMPATFTFGGFLSTQGGGGHLDYGFGRGKQQIMVSLDAYTLHDRRETKIESDFKEQGGPYTFGKLNYVFIVSPTIGIQRNLFPDEDRNLIGFHVSAQIGPSIAFLIPYKVDIFTPIAGRPQFGRKVVENYDPSRHGYEDIIRRAKVFDGDLEAENQIGLSIRTNLYLDLSKNPEYLSGVRIGVNADVYPDELPIMGITENKKSYITGTVGLIFGFKSN